MCSTQIQGPATHYNKKKKRTQDAEYFFLDEIAISTGIIIRQHCRLG